ncbi:MAG: CBS domain-containing protein [Methanobacteriaceae archaeon]|jgi:CBS domain-containing protein|nr:CBS domain-containing protein [Methanobacteriaceae archaeon]OPY24508.1 MAG: Inosine-5'-monophosphate dehydrogenase [Methanobacterium sp. PtaU1.Bin097]
MRDDLKAKNVMIETVQTISPTDLIAAAKLKMMRSNVGGLPVVDDGKLVGIITHRDILLAGGEAVGLKVEELMSKNLRTAEPDTSLLEIIKIMVDEGYQRIPVIKNGKLIGLVTQSSVIRAIAELIGP